MLFALCIVLRCAVLCYYVCERRWGGDYLVKAAIADTSASADVIQLVAQVGSIIIDCSGKYYGRM